ncbi:MAG: tyrosine-protein phosphatase [Gordonia sp. (in: high G+C Gram-positive bacteria)]|uniref:tyrosine-protein phosphatase n=1 Tax=Gordonia sp. (in: high G+C Gram-positive bacteria) TaxID=84139 RepID=UPI0039E32168
MLTTVRPARRRRLLSAAAAIALVLTPATTALTAAPADAAPAPYRVKVDGAFNTRGLATYTTNGGRGISGKVFRSSDLSQVTPVGQQQLAQLGVRSIIDLRSDPERAMRPDVAVPFAPLFVADVMRLAPFSGYSNFPGMYQTFVDNPGALVAWRAMVLKLTQTARAGGTTVINCTAGRDRSGWAMALILRLLDAPMETIEADFQAQHDGVDVAWMRGAFQHANALYGNWDNYVRVGLRLTPQDVHALRAALLR